MIINFFSQNLFKRIVKYTFYFVLYNKFYVFVILRVKVRNNILNNYIITYYINFE